jgi:hypothetical protein
LVFFLLLLLLLLFLFVYFVVFFIKCKFHGRKQKMGEIYIMETSKYCDDT